MGKKVVFIESNSNDPRFNLALEQYVFDEMPNDREYFWLWQNHNTIVVGKHQNTAQEINQTYVREHGITVVRRLSGGGAVYHDMGNVNFTFIADTGDMETLNLHAFCTPVVNTLEQIGVKAEVSGRNDITIDGKKFSGNSQYIKHGRIMHHGTLMFDSDLSVVSKALQVSSDKYESKGFKSVKSRVTNIKPYAPADMDMETFKNILKQYMVQGEDVEIHHLSEEELKRDHSGIPHGGFVLRSGKTGWDGENSHLIEYSLKLDSNPEFTSSVIVAYARAAYRLAAEGQSGCKTVFDIAPAYLSAKSGEELRKEML